MSEPVSLWALISEIRIATGGLVMAAMDSLEPHSRHTAIPAGRRDNLQARPCLPALAAP